MLRSVTEAVTGLRIDSRYVTSTEARGRHEWGEGEMILSWPSLSVSMILIITDFVVEALHIVKH
jgi:hypothetical protein